MKTTFENRFSDNFHRIPQSYIREILNYANKPGMISFAGGLPNPDFFPSQQLQKSANEVFMKQGSEVLQYSGSQGYFPLRKFIADRYNKMYDLHIDPNNVVITSGSQQSIDVTSKMLVNPNDGVIVEAPTYLGGVQALSAYSPEFLEVDLHKNGPDLLQIEKYILNHIPKFMYGIPNFQNPSGLCYSNEYRKNLAKLLSNYELPMLEDDPYNEIRFEGEQSPPIYKYAPNQVLWSGSFSKMVAPGLRLGWIVLPNGLTSHFLKAKQSTDLHTNNLSQYVIHHYLEHNDIDEHLQRVNAAYKSQCFCMVQAINKHFPKECTYEIPQGGMFLWIKLPEGINSHAFAQKCLKKGVAIVPGDSFFTGVNATQNIRLNFSNSSSEIINKGIKIIAEELKKETNKVFY